MLYQPDPSGYKELLPGIFMKTLTYGDSSHLCEFQLKRGAVIPAHQHPQEQTGYLVSGRIVLNIGGDSFEANAGDSWCIPGNVEHGAHILQDAVAIEVFSPVRKDYLPK